VQLVRDNLPDALWSNYLHLFLHHLVDQIDAWGCVMDSWMLPDER
jgi:hypothetical protein